MLSLNTDRFWTILFTVPLPLVLSSVAVAQEATVDPEPIRIATETTIKPVAIDVGNLNFHQPKLESWVDQSAARWIHQTVTNAQWAMLDRVDPLRLIHPTNSPTAVAPIEIGVTHSGCVASDFNTTAKHIVAGRPPGVAVAKPSPWVAGDDAVTQIRRDKFVSFDSQAPPRNSRAIVSIATPKYFIRFPFRKFNRGAQSPSEPRIRAANPILSIYRATFDVDLVLSLEPRCGNAAESALIPPNDFRRPQRFRLELLILV